MFKILWLFEYIAIPYTSGYYGQKISIWEYHRKHLPIILICEISIYEGCIYEQIRSL